jgi:2'-5' RNA ligase
VTRTFVALWIPSDWTEYIAGISQDLATRTGGLSWVRPENVHVTIRFLGDLGDSGVRRACDSVAAGVADEPAPRARLGGLGAFPGFGKPRVVWIGLSEGAEPVASLARSVNRALDRDGFGGPDRPFRAHLTLARVRERARGAEALAAAALPPPPGAAFLHRLAVMKSDLHPAGARYTALREILLRLPAD